MKWYLYVVKKQFVRETKSLKNNLLQYKGLVLFILQTTTFLSKLSQAKERRGWGGGGGGVGSA